MFHDKLTALKTFGQIFFDRFFDHSWTGKTNESSGFCDVEITEHPNDAEIPPNVGSVNKEI